MHGMQEVVGSSPIRSTIINYMKITKVIEKISKSLVRIVKVEPQSDDYFEELEPKITDIDYFVDDLYVTKKEVIKYINIPDDDDIYALIFDKISSVLW